MLYLVSAILLLLAVSCELFNHAPQRCYTDTELQVGNTQIAVLIRPTNSNQYFNSNVIQHFFSYILNICNVFWDR